MNVLQEALIAAETKARDSDHLALVARVAMISRGAYDTDDLDVRALVRAIENVAKTPETSPPDWREVERLLELVEKSRTPKEFVAVAADGNRPGDFEAER